MSTFQVMKHKLQPLIIEIFNEIGNLRPEYDENTLYSKTLLPVYSYLLEINAFNCYASSDGSHIGKNTKSVFGIPNNSYIKITSIHELKTKIEWVKIDVNQIKNKIFTMELKNNIETINWTNAELLNELIERLFTFSNYNIYLFEKFGFEIKSKIITLNFSFEDI